MFHVPYSLDFSRFLFFPVVLQKHIIITAKIDGLESRHTTKCLISGQSLSDFLSDKALRVSHSDKMKYY